jgi:hypothetical protein
MKYEIIAKHIALHITKESAVFMVVGCEHRHIHEL